MFFLFELKYLYALPQNFIPIGLILLIKLTYEDSINFTF